jgi:hypothetical protein
MIDFAELDAHNFHRTTSDPREEPGALAAHAGISAVGEEKSSSLPRPFRLCDFRTLSCCVPMDAGCRPNSESGVRDCSLHGLKWQYYWLPDRRQATGSQS